MKYIISSVNPHKVAAVFGMYLGIISILFVPLFLLTFAFSQNLSKTPVPSFSYVLILLVPVMYGIMGYVMTYVGCKIYNFIAKRFIQIELNLELQNE